MPIVPITPAEAPALSALIHRIYPAHFTYLWDDGGAWYLDYAYNPAQLRTELFDPNVRYFWAMRTEQSVGYLKLNLDKPLPSAPEPGGLEVERIYLLPEVAGRGLGTLLIGHAEAVARQLGKRYLWLHVMDSSLDSIAFYEKRGFRRVGETALPFERMQPKYRRMWQLKKTL